MKLRDIFSAMPTQSTFHEDYAIDAAITFPDFNSRYAKIVGTFDGLDVWDTRFFEPNHHTFAFRNESGKAIAFVVIEENMFNGAHPLVRMWSDKEHRKRGLITALILFITKKLQLRLIIKSDEPLTDQGRNWLVAAVKSNKIKAINAATNRPLTIDDVTKDIENRKSINTHTDLSVIIESGKSRYPLFGSGGHRQLNEMIFVVDGPDEID